MFKNKKYSKVLLEKIQKWKFVWYEGILPKLKIENNLKIKSSKMEKIEVSRKIKKTSMKIKKNVTKITTCAKMKTHSMKNYLKVIQIIWQRTQSEEKNILKIKNVQNFKTIEN